MFMTELSYEGIQPIDAYGQGGFRIGGRRIEGSVIIGPEGGRSWGAGTADDVSAESLAPLLAQARDYDVLLLGLGMEVMPLAPALRAAAEAAGAGLDLMTTPAACRTYNILVAEGRRVAAGLIAV